MLNRERKYDNKCNIMQGLLMYLETQNITTSGEEKKHATKMVPRCLPSKQNVPAARNIFLHIDLLLSACVVFTFFFSSSSSSLEP